MSESDSAARPLDTVRPTVSSVTAQTGQAISVAFSEAMLAPGIATAADYALSGAGVGNLGATPSTVTGTGPYTLTWSSGEMLNGGPIAVTVAGVQDLAGNLIATPNSGAGTGIGSIPTGAIHVNTATPGYINSTTVDLTLSASDAVGVAKMRFSNDGAAWVPASWGVAPAYAASYTSWNLTSGDGLKTVYAQYQDDAGNVSTATISDTITFVNWPGFAIEPQDGQEYTGDSHTFEVSVARSIASGTETYQWKWDNGAIIQNGPATPAWTLTGLTAANRGEYWCEVNFLGAAHPTRHAVLSVEDHIEIVQQPQSVEVHEGEAQTFTVLASGGYPPLHYQWRKESFEIPNATGASYTIASIQDTDYGRYSVEIQDSNTDVRASGTAILRIFGLALPLFGIAGTAVLLGLIAIGGARTMRKK